MHFTSEKEFFKVAQENRKYMSKTERQKYAIRMYSKDLDESARMDARNKIIGSYLWDIKFEINEISKKVYSQINKLELINRCVQTIETEIANYDFFAAKDDLSYRISSRLRVIIVGYLFESLDDPSMDVSQVFFLLDGGGITLGKLYELAKMTQEMLDRGVDVSMDLNGVIYYNWDTSFYYEGPLKKETRIHYRLVNRFFGLQRYEKTKITLWYYDI